MTTPFVVLATSENHDYSFYAPLTCRFWRELVGFTPILIVVGDRDEWMASPKMRLIVISAGEAGASIEWVHRIPSVGDGNVAQVARLLGAAGYTNSDQLFMTGDVDMWPLSKRFYQPIDPEKINLYGANFYGGDRVPMNYVMATGSAWWEMMAFANIEIGGTINQSFAKVSFPVERRWDFDEDLLEKAIKGWGGKEACACRDRKGSRHKLAPGRVDRANWVYNGPEPDLVDAHLPRPGYIEENWTRVRPIIKDYLPDSLAWADAYHKAYMELQ